MSKVQQAIIVPEYSELQNVDDTMWKSGHITMRLDSFTIGAWLITCFNETDKSMSYCPSFQLSL
jgi:hypothetical protein